MATFRDYVHGARPKTLSAAVVPVALGSTLAYWYLNEMSKDETEIRFSIAVLIGCAVVSLFLQIGVNYANDFSDGVKGVDENRVGPMRLVGSGKASSRSVFVAMIISFSIASIAGIFVASQSTWWFVAIGVACLALAWFYTGSKHSYGYYGFGELAAFICFGLVATVGTFFALTSSFAVEPIFAGVLTGLFSVAILLANNIRDIKTDLASGKKTLAARMGAKSAKQVFMAVFFFVALSIFLLGLSIPLVWLSIILLALAIPIIKMMLAESEAVRYIEILVATSKLNLIIGAAISSLVLLSTI